MLARMWDPRRNQVALRDVRVDSDYEFWFRCKKHHDVTFKQSPANVRTGYASCPQCDSVEAKSPELARLWHPTKNKELSPKDVHFRCRSFKVWMICDEGHETKVYPALFRSRRIGCIACSTHAKKPKQHQSLKHLYPVIANLLHTSKNGTLTADKLFPNSQHEVWLQCRSNSEHTWKSKVLDLTKRYRKEREFAVFCPLCRHKEVGSMNSLRAADPFLSSFWHPTKNGDDTPETTVAHSWRTAWFQCTYNPKHEWKMRIARNVGYHDSNPCPYCRNYRVDSSNAVGTRIPGLAKVWDDEANTRSPDNVYYRSRSLVWVRCCQDHNWRFQIKPRRVSDDHLIGTRHCPLCSSLDEYE